MSVQGREVTLDSCRYEYTDGGTMILSGWTSLDPTDLVFQARIGDKKTGLSYEAVRRPDVEAAFPDLFPASEEESARCPGFEIRIPGMKKAIAEGKTVYVRALSGGRPYRVSAVRSEEIERELGKSSLKYLIEKAEKRGEEVCIRGWYVSFTGNGELHILDNGTDEIPLADIEYRRRMDLSEAFSVDMSCCFGFEVSFPRDAVTGRKVNLEFRNEFASETYVIDMREFDIMNSRAGRIFSLISWDRQKELQGILKKKGIRYLLGYIEENSLPSEEHYAFYQKHKAASPGELARQSRANISPAPLFSIIVPVYHWDAQLSDLADSLTAQTYGNWELILAGASSAGELSGDLSRDRRIKYVIKSGPLAGRIAGAVSAAGGDYYLFAAQDSIFTPDMLYRFVSVLHSHPETEMIYTDTDHYIKTPDRTDGCSLLKKKIKYCCPQFKPEPDPDYLCSYNYIGMPLMVSSRAFESFSSGGWKYTTAGSFGYSLALSGIRRGEHMRHIPYAACHLELNKEDENKTAETADKDAAEHIALVEKYYKDEGTEAKAELSEYSGVLKTGYEIKGNPLVSILIPNKDHVPDLKKCIDSVIEKSTWKNIEIIIIENNSTESETESYYKSIVSDPRIRVVHYKGEFNYSSINNFGSAAASGDYLILLNNDTEVLTPDWIECLLGYCQREGTGIAGARLLYPDGTLQHGGVVIGTGGTAGHESLGRPKDYTGMLNRIVSARRAGAVTGACMMVKKEVYRKVGGLDPDFAVAFNDVDFCLRAGAEGEKTVYVPSAVLYHYESKSRGYESTPEKAARFREESDRLRKRHGDYIRNGDPCYNPNLTLLGTECREKTVFEGKEETNR